MKQNTRNFIVICGTIFSIISAFQKAQAADTSQYIPPSVKAENVRNIFGKSSNYLGFAIGRYDTLDDKTATEFKTEYASGTPLWGPFKPLLVVQITEDASFYAGAGVYIDYLPHKNIYIKPSLTVGVYEEGSGKDLGDGAIFRTQLEMGYQFESLHRMGISFSHSSNGGQDKNNTGTEIVSLYYHIPIESLFSRNRNGDTKILSRHARHSGSDRL